MTSDSDGTKKKADRRGKPRRNEKGDMLKMYEKNRRDRFNIKIELLASLLPNYNKENPWPKQEIISNSIEFISSKKGESLRSLELLRSMKIEIEKLKDVILAYTEFKYQKYDIHKLSSVEIKSILKQLSENNNRMCDQPPIQTLVQPPIQTLVQPQIQTLVQPQIQTLVPIQSQIPVSSQPMNKSRSEASQSNRETDVNSEQFGSLGGSGGLGGPDCSSKIPMIINATQSSLPTSQHFGQNPPILQNTLIAPNPPTVQNSSTVQQILVYSQPSLQTSLVNQSINQSLKPILLQAVSSVGINKSILLERGLSQPRPIQIQQIQGTSVIAPKLIQPR
ncbi:uncharacterized protein LOC111696561 [Eurytemora carolleeae]|uniref:uncharacterized protein LOC111696561 n=1 Tax=Eurytemora carolleeae TaxID=1294199 RepID=UPI000C776F84|nr:uncharacterized protein LOC111696561 [Eurytemora carolleeae]|eukprot:XP_023321963.1 uncharacterized protein LOC111696561 [Eurytemora affinis]